MNDYYKMTVSTEDALSILQNQFNIYQKNTTEKLAMLDDQIKKQINLIKQFVNTVQNISINLSIFNEKVEVVEKRLTLLNGSNNYMYNKTNYAEENLKKTKIVLNQQIAQTKKFFQDQRNANLIFKQNLTMLQNQTLIIHSKIKTKKNAEQSQEFFQQFVNASFNEITNFTHSSVEFCDSLVQSKLQKFSNEFNMSISNIISQQKRQFNRNNSELKTFMRNQTAKLQNEISNTRRDAQAASSQLSAAITRQCQVFSNEAKEEISRQLKASQTAWKNTESERIDASLSNLKTNLDHKARRYADLKEKFVGLNKTVNKNAGKISTITSQLASLKAQSRSKV